MIINKEVREDIEYEMQKLVIEAEQDQETLHNLIKTKGVGFACCSCSEKIMQNLGDAVGYKYIGPDVWVDRGEKVKVFVLHHDKGNLYKRLGLCKFGCIIQVGELMTITGNNK